MESRIERARGLLSSGQTTKALAVLRELTGAYPKDVTPWRELGKALASLGRDVEALDALTRSTWIVGRDLDTWILMAVSAHRLDRHKEALSYWRSALEIQPKLFQQHAHLGVLWRESRSKDRELERIVVRLTTRDDPFAFTLLLDAVFGPTDAGLALDLLLAMPSQSPAIRLATEALRIAIGDSMAHGALIQLVAMHDDERRELLWTRLFRWLAVSSGLDPDEPIISILQASSDRAVVRAAYGVSRVGSRSQRAAIFEMAQSVLQIVRQIDDAA